MAEKPLTSRQLKAQESRKKIFDTAVALFDQKGYDNVSIAEICEEAGFATGSFYYYFGSKDRVMRERYLPFAMDVDSVYEAMHEAIKQEGKSNFEQLVEFGHLILLGISSMGVETSMVAFIRQVGPSYLSSQDNLSLLQPYKVVSRIVAEGQKAGEFRNDVSVEAVTQIIIRSIMGAIFDWVVRDGSFDLPQAGDEYLELLLGGLRAR